MIDNKMNNKILKSLVIRIVAENSNNQNWDVLQTSSAPRPQATQDDATSRKGFGKKFRNLFKRNEEKAKVSVESEFANHK